MVVRGQIPRGVVATALVQAGDDLVGQPLHDAPVQVEHALEQRVEIDSLRPHDLTERRRRQHHVPGDIELHVRGAGRDRIVHEAAQDADQEGRRRERHLHDPGRQSAHEGGLTGGRAVDLGDPAPDGDRSLVLDDAAVVAAELQRALTRGQAVDCVEERVEVHEATELPVGHDLEPDRFLPRHHPTDGIVLEVAQAREILGPLLGQQRRVAGLVGAMHLLEQRLRSLQTADVVGPDLWAHVPLLVRV